MTSQPPLQHASDLIHILRSFIKNNTAYHEKLLHNRCLYQGWWDRKGFSGKKDSWYVYEPSNYAALEELEAAIQIYPNPVTAQLNISGLKGLIDNVTVYNTTGQKLLTQDISGSFEETLAISHLKEGVLLLNFTLEDGQVLTKKILKL